MIGLLLTTNTLLLLISGWQYRENRRLRQEGLAIGQGPIAPLASPGDARRVSDMARVGQIEQLKRLLDAHPELLNSHHPASDSTPLHHAVFYRQDAIVQELLMRNADVGATNRGGLTPLHDCVNRGTIEAAVMLLDRGGSLMARNTEGQTPLAYALDKNRTDMVDLLRQRGAKE